MPGCKPTCVVEMYATHNPSHVSLCRRKWNYVKNLYQPNYKVDDTGTRIECYDYELLPISDPPICHVRATDDPARIDDEDKWDEAFQIDYDNWIGYLNLGGAIEKTTSFEKWLQWQYRIGTTAYGNLPQHKRNDHDGHCWMPCPYSSDSSAERSDAMWDVHDDPSLTKNDHGDNYMQTDSNGTAWGWRCTYSGCPYETAYNKPYFYV